MSGVYVLLINKPFEFICLCPKLGCKKFALTAFLAYPLLHIVDDLNSQHPNPETGSMSRWLRLKHCLAFSFPILELAISLVQAMPSLFLFWTYARVRRLERDITRARATSCRTTKLINSGICIRSKVLRGFLLSA